MDEAMQATRYEMSGEADREAQDDRLIQRLTKALGEARERIEALDAQVARMEGEIETLKSEAIADAIYAAEMESMRETIAPDPSI